MTTHAMRQTKALERRIRLFYRLLNRGQHEQCYLMIDPAVRDDPASVTLFQYREALDQFMHHFVAVKVKRVRVDLHLGEPNKLYGGRDFAVGETTWEDGEREERSFQERWVRQGRRWYTRSTGFVTPGLKRFVRDIVPGLPVSPPPS